MSVRIVRTFVIPAQLMIIDKRHCIPRPLFNKRALEDCAQIKIWPLFARFIESVVEGDVKERGLQIISVLSYHR